MKITIAITFVALALFALPALAQSDGCGDEFYAEVRICGEGGGGGWSDSTAYSNGEYMDNPCTAAADWVWVDYSASVDLYGWQTDTGQEPVLFDELTTLGGGTYAASGTSQSEVAAAQAYSLRKYHKVNTPDDFHVVTVIDFNPATRQTTITRETACGNGLPESAQ